jgi:ATP-dependent RNA helicase DDX60
VEHPHRYSHLRKFVYLPSYKKQEFNGFGNPDSRLPLEKVSELAPVHPYASLTISNGTFPPDLALDPNECFTLFSAMKTAASKSTDSSISNEIRRFQPQLFFKSTPYIKTADVIKYEAELRQVMQKWIISPAHKDVLTSALESLGGELRNHVSAMESTYDTQTPYAFENYGESLLPLLDKLNSADALPALIFHYDRHGIECMAQTLLEQLESAERQWQSTNPAWKTKLQTWNDWQSDAKNRAKREELKAKTAKKKSLEEETRQKEVTWLDSFDPDAALPQFSFQSMRSKLDNKELLKEIEELEKWNNTAEWIGRCLRRGIGIHHSGLNRRLRELVEMFFRAGTLRVVIATGMLSFAIY